MECFCAEGCVRWLEEKVKETEKKHGGRGLVTFYAANNKAWRFFFAEYDLAAEGKCQIG